MGSSHGKISLGLSCTKYMICFNKIRDLQVTNKIHHSIFLVISSCQDIAPKHATMQTFFNNMLKTGQLEKGLNSISQICNMISIHLDFIFVYYPETDIKFT